MHSAAIRYIDIFGRVLKVIRHDTLAPEGFAQPFLTKVNNKARIRASRTYFQEN